MHGGRLSFRNVAIVEEHDLLVAAFSHQIYHFNLRQGTIISKDNIHQSPILDLLYHSDSQTLTSIDSTGLVLQQKINKDGRFECKSKPKPIFKCDYLSQGRVVSNQEGEIEFYGLIPSGKLMRYVGGMLSTISLKCSKILYLSKDFIIFRIDMNKVEVIMNLGQGSKRKDSYQYQHNCEISSVQVYKTNLLIGDQKGKISILNNFLQNGKVQLRQKLEWHVHEVTALTVSGSYLYSVGQEGVVALWHLRQNKRDFLPRIGSKIMNVIVRDSKVFCLLANNAIKCIDMSEDKAVVDYRVIMEPRVECMGGTSIKGNIVRVTDLGDRIFLRGQPGKIQQINLGNGLNIEHSIVGRNIISRLDSNYPQPHSITDMCFSDDSNRMVAVIQGINCRSLRFYSFDQGEYTLISKVENCHKGSEEVKISTFSDRFISWSASDSAIKIWKLQSKRKQSILEIQQHFWACEYELSYRNKLPSFLSYFGQKIVITYKDEFLIFNTLNKTIQQTYQSKQQSDIYVAVYQQGDNEFIVVKRDTVELIKCGGKAQKSQKIIDLSVSQQMSAFISSNLVINNRTRSLAILINGQERQAIYLYQNGHSSSFEIEKTGSIFITDIFWLGSRLMALDSTMMFYDVTHGQEMVSFAEQKDSLRGEGTQTMEEEQNITTAGYSTLCNRYLDRKYRSDRITLQKAGQIFSLTPSISQSFSYLSSQLFV